MASASLNQLIAAQMREAFLVVARRLPNWRNKGANEEGTAPFLPQQEERYAFDRSALKQKNALLRSSVRKNNNSSLTVKSL